MAETGDLLNDFEEVQKDSVSSTEMAEEDRYGGSGEVDLMGGFGSDMPSQSDAAKVDNLMDFGMGSPETQVVPETTVTESTPPREFEGIGEEPVKPVVEEQPESVAATEANLLKNVDPRDDSIFSSTQVEPDTRFVEDVPQPASESGRKPDTASASNGVLELVYWKDVKKTGVVFGTMMFILISLACFTLLSVLAYLSLAILTVTFTFRVYKNVMQAVQKTSDGHPFKNLMEMEIELNDEVVKKAADNIARHVNNCSRELRRLYLVGDYVDSLKFGLLLWVLTYIGAWFNGMTLVILAVVSIFTLPKVYDTYKVQIDSYINMARAQLNKIMAQITSKIPFPKKKAKTQ